MTTPLKTLKLCKSYGEKKALLNIDLKVQAGERIALLGCNGAGKTSLINLIMGLKEPTSGEIKVFETTPFSKENKHRISYLPQFLSYPEHLKVKEIIYTIRKHFNQVSDSKALLKQLELDVLKDRIAHSLSGGEMRKVGVYLSLIRPPGLVIMDEPTASIDLLGKSNIYEAINEHLSLTNSTFIFSSHEMKEVEKMAQRVVVLNKGEVVADDSLEKIKNQFGLTEIKFKSEKSLIPIRHSVRSDKEKNTHSFFVKDSTEALKEIFSKYENINDLKLHEPSLDEIFIKLWSAPQESEAVQDINL